MTKEYWCVIRNNEEGVYFIVFKEFIKKGYLKTVKDSNLQLLADNDPTARQIIDGYVVAKIIDYDLLLSVSDKYVYVPANKSKWFDWLVIEK